MVNTFLNDRRGATVVRDGERESVRLDSLDFPGTVEFTLDDVPGKRAGDWGNFPRGAARALQERYPLWRGIVGLTSGSLHGGGVSAGIARARKP